MRLGVLDVGSNTVHLLVVDAHPGARPWPATSHKTELRLAESLDADGAVSSQGAQDLATFVSKANELSQDLGCEELLAFATSAVREAPNGAVVLDAVLHRTGVKLEVLSGEDEARLTFLAVRRWFGWSAGRVLALDIGGGSLEMAVGTDEDPDWALSLPLGAGRVTREHRLGGPVDPGQLTALRRLVRARVATVGRDLAKAGVPDQVVGSSKTFRSLARICGAAPSAEGPYVPRFLSRAVLADWLPRLAGMSAEERAQLPGVSSSRAPQVLAGAVVAEAAMDLMGVDQLRICPWALREGIILRRLDWLDTGWLPLGDGVAPA